MANGGGGAGEGPAVAAAPGGPPSAGISPGLLEEGAKVAFFDVHVTADHWAAGGSLDKEKMQTMATYAP